MTETGTGAWHGLSGTFERDLGLTMHFTLFTAGGRGPIPLELAASSRSCALARGCAGHADGDERIQGPQARLRASPYLSSAM